MDIKTFISESLTQLAEGIVDAQMRTADTGMLIQPPFAGIGNGTYVPKKDDGRSPYQTVSFDIAVTASEESQKGIGGGLRVAFLNTDGKMSSHETDMSVSRISFHVVVKLPPHTSANTKTE